MTAIRNSIFVLAACMFLAGCGWYTLPGDDDPFRASQTDIDILLAAKELLADESKWTRHEEQQCNMDAAQWTLFCALQKASFEVTGDFQLRRAALEEARMATEEVAGKTLERRLLDFNNMPSTTFEDIQRVLDLALLRIHSRIENS